MESFVSETRLTAIFYYLDEELKEIIYHIDI